MQTSRNPNLYCSNNNSYNNKHNNKTMLRFPKLLLLNMFLVFAITQAAKNQGDCLLGSLCSSLIRRTQQRAKLYPQYAKVPKCFKSTIRAKLRKSEYGCLNETDVYQVLHECAQTWFTVVKGKAATRVRNEPSTEPEQSAEPTNLTMPSTLRFLVNKLNDMRAFLARKRRERWASGQIVSETTNRQVRFRPDRDCRSCCLILDPSESFTRNCFRTVCASRRSKC